MFGVDFSNKPALKQAVTQAVIDRIVERTKEDSKSWTGSKFAGYSKAYKDSLAYKAAGKTGKVDLTLTGEMLGTVDVQDETDNKVVIGWSDTLDAAKAHGHITGNVGKTRDFFGINNSEIKEIKAEFKDDFKQADEGGLVGQAFREMLLERIRRLSTADEVLDLGQS